MANNGLLTLEEPDEINEVAEARGATERKAQAHAVILDALRFAASAEGNPQAQGGKKTRLGLYLLACIFLTGLGAVVIWLATRTV